MPRASRMYDDLARWWPLISPVADYREEATGYAKVLREAHVNDVLELGSGGGNNASYLKESFAMTLVDLSEGMLAHSRALNPGCDHHKGDMRSIRLGRRFDAVFVHDAVDHMTTIGDLRQLFETAFSHLHPGGIALFVPDHLTETYEPGVETGGSDADGYGVRYIEWSHPVNTDRTVSTDYAFMCRTPDGRTQTEHDRHVYGLFAKQEWKDSLRAAGFENVRLVPVHHEEIGATGQMFVAHRP